MVNFIDLFPEIKDNVSDYKVHLASIAETDPLDEFVKGNFTEWQERQSKRNFERKYIISFISFGPDEWLFAGIFKRMSYEFRNNYYYYVTEPLDINSDLIGRLIIRYKKLYRQSYPYLENCMSILKYHKY
jgi:hypothetical protein